MTKEATGALPTVAPGMGADPTASQEYIDAINKQLAALEGRQTPNLMQIASAFMNPGRTGNFGEALGNAMGVIGKQQEEQEARAPAIAQMRAALAGQKFKMSQQSEAMKYLNQMAGGNPNITEEDLPQIAQKMGVSSDDPKLKEFVGHPKSIFMTSEGSSMVGVNAQPTVNQQEMKQALIAAGGDPAAAIKMIYERQTKWGEPSQLQKDIAYAMRPDTPDSVKQMVFAKVNADAERLGIDKTKLFYETGINLTGKQPTTAPTTTVDVMPIKDLATQLMTDFGLKPEQLSLERTRDQQANLIKRAEAGEPGVYKPAPLVEGKEVYHQGAIDVPSIVPPSYMAARGYIRPDPKGDPPHYVPMSSKSPKISQQTASDENGYITPSGEYVPFPPGTTPKGKEELRQEAAKSAIGVSSKSQEESNKYWNTQKDDIYTQGAPHTVSRLKGNIEKVWETAEKYPDIYGQLAGQGFFNALASSLQKGPNTSFGEFSGNVEDFIAKLKLDDPMLAIKTDIARTMAQIFFDNAQVAKTVLGKFTDQDARLAQAPLASLKDPANSVIHWAGESIIALQQREKATDLLHEWEKTHKGVPVKEFFNSREYKKIFSDANTEMKEWRKRSPLYKVE